MENQLLIYLIDSSRWAESSESLFLLARIPVKSFKSKICQGNNKIMSKLLNDI